MKNKTKLIRFTKHLASYQSKEIENYNINPLAIYINPDYVIAVEPWPVKGDVPFRSSPIVSQILTTNGYWLVDCDVRTVINCLSI